MVLYSLVPREESAVIGTHCSLYLDMMSDGSRTVRPDLFPFGCGIHPSGISDLSPVFLTYPYLSPARVLFLCPACELCVEGSITASENLRGDDRSIVVGPSSDDRVQCVYDLGL